ncbi:MAG: hypothetical protein ACI8P9_000854 [Parasphingorhabdus sp.]|jgi:hypothetical protein
MVGSRLIALAFRNTAIFDYLMPQIVVIFGPVSIAIAGLHQFKSAVHFVAWINL